MLNEIYQGEENQSVENQATNIASVSGTIQSEAKFSHEVYGEGFYSFFISVPRLSEAHDIIPVTVSERLVPPGSLHIGDTVTINGKPFPLRLYGIIRGYEIYESK